MNNLQINTTINMATRLNGTVFIKDMPMSMALESATVSRHDVYYLCDILFSSNIMELERIEISKILYFESHTIKMQIHNTLI